MDGARIWEALAGYQKADPTRTYAQLCANFDSIYVSFYKGIGAMTGSMLFGTKVFVGQAKIWQRRFGGNLFTQVPYYTHAALMYRLHGSSFGKNFERAQGIVSTISSQVTDSRLRFVPPVPETGMVHVYLKCTVAEAEKASKSVEAKTGIRVFAKMRAQIGEECFFEWKFGPSNINIPNEIFVKGWKTFFEELK